MWEPEGVRTTFPRSHFGGGFIHLQASLGVVLSTPDGTKTTLEVPQGSTTRAPGVLVQPSSGFYFGWLTTHRFH